MIWPTDRQLSDVGIVVFCPDCGAYLWDDTRRDFAEECSKCFWPQPDFEVEGEG